MSINYQRKQGYKHTSLGWIPEEWEVTRLGEIGEFFKGKGILKEQVLENGFPCIRYGEIYTTHDFIIKEFKSFINEDVAKESQEISTGDILFAGSGETIEEIGKAVAFIGNEKAFAGGDVIIFRPKKDNSEAISYLLEIDSSRKQKRIFGQGNSVVHIYPSELKKLKIPLPPLTEQNKITIILNIWDHAITKTQQLISQLQQRNKGLMQQLLTGGKRLKGFEKSKWHIKSIGEIAAINKKTLSQKTDGDFAFFYIDLSAVKDGKIEFPNEKISYKNSSPRARRCFERGDILMATVRPNLKGFAYVNFDPSEMICSTGFAVIHAHSNPIGEFIFYSLFAKNIEFQINQLITGSNYPAINSSDVDGLILNVPDNENEISGITKIIFIFLKETEYYEKYLEILKQQKKGLMQKLLTGEVRVKV